MSDDWLDISDDNIDVEEIMQKIRERTTHHTGVLPSDDSDRPEMVAEALWAEMIEEPIESSTFVKGIQIRQRDCDIVPRYYVIDWRIPILGPIHAVVRRLINAEICRYLLPSLKKQSSFNLKVRRALKELAQENTRLRQEIEKLQQDQNTGQP